MFLSLTYETSPEHSTSSLLPQERAMSLLTQRDVVMMMALNSWDFCPELWATREGPLLERRKGAGRRRHIGSKARNKRRRTGDLPPIKRKSLKLKDHLWATAWHCGKSPSHWGSDRIGFRIQSSHLMENFTLIYVSWLTFVLFTRSAEIVVTQVDVRTQQGTNNNGSHVC